MQFTNQNLDDITKKVKEELYKMTDAITVDMNNDEVTKILKDKLVDAGVDNNELTNIFNEFNKLPSDENPVVKVMSNIIETHKDDDTIVGNTFNKMYEKYLSKNDHNGLKTEILNSMMDYMPVKLVALDPMKMKIVKTYSEPSKVDKNGICYDTSDEESSDDDLSEEEYVDDEYEENIAMVDKILFKYPDVDSVPLGYVVLFEINDEKYIKYGYTNDLYQHLRNLLGQLHGEYEDVKLCDVIGFLKVKTGSGSQHYSSNYVLKERRKFLFWNFPKGRCLERRFSTEEHSSYYQNFLKYNNYMLDYIMKKDYTPECISVYFNPQFMSN